MVWIWWVPLWNFTKWAGDQGYTFMNGSIYSVDELSQDGFSENSVWQVLHNPIFTMWGPIAPQGCQQEGFLWGSWSWMTTIGQNNSLLFLTYPVCIILLLATENGQQITLITSKRQGLLPFLKELTFYLEQKKNDKDINDRKISKRTTFLP